MENSEYIRLFIKDQKLKQENERNFIERGFPELNDIRLNTEKNILITKKTEHIFYNQMEL